MAQDYQSADVSYDSVQALYHVYYWDLTEAGEDTLVYGAVLSGKAADASIAGDVVPTSPGLLGYSYTITNGPDGTPDIVTPSGNGAPRGIRTLGVKTDAQVDSVAADSSWRGTYIYNSNEVSWIRRGLFFTGIGPDSSLAGFAFTSSGLPVIENAYVASERGFLGWGEGPIYTGVIATVDSLEALVLADTLTTIGPRDPPNPFDLGDFLDTLGTYPLRAAAQGWIADSTAGDLDRLLGDAVTALSGGDSTWAATLLATVRNHVETVKDDSLTSEGYALMKYNIDYALGYMPAIVRVKVFPEGAYASGTLKQQILNSIPKNQPFGDTLGAWHYYGEETLTRVPKFTADWVLMSAVSADTVLVGQSVSLLDDQGVATVAFEHSMPDSAYVVVDHRNHALVMSDTLLDIAGGYAEHDFTAGNAYSAVYQPQHEISAGLYAMWAADGRQDGLITALDFTLWLRATTAGETGYRPSDYNVDTQVTALDFIKWIANTTAGGATGVPDPVYDILYPDEGSGFGGLLELQEAQATGPQSYVRLNITRDTGQDFWVNVEAKTDVADKTLAAFTVDVYYDSSEVSFESTDPGVLQEGYSSRISDRYREGRRFVRVDVAPDHIGYTYLGHDLGTDWEVIRTIYFSRTPPKHDPGTTIRVRSLAISFFTVHSNLGYYNVTVRSPVEIQ